MILLKLLNFFSLKTLFLFFTSLFSIASPFITFQGLWKILSGWHRPLFASVDSNSTGHQLLPLPKGLGWDSGIQSVSEIFMFALTCLTMSSDISMLSQKSLPAVFFSMVKSRGKVKTPTVASCCWPEVYYWTEHCPVASTTWFIPNYYSKPPSGSVYSPLFPSVLKNSSPLVIS